MVTLAEKILNEVDGTVSLVRLIQRINVRAHGTQVPETLPAGRVSLHMYVLLWGGESRGRHMITIRRESPSGLSADIATLPVHLEPGNRSEGIELDLLMDVDQEGLYWFDVVFEGRVLTRTPLEIRYEPLPQGLKPGDA